MAKDIDLDLALVRRAAGSPRIFDVGQLTRALDEDSPGLFATGPLGRVILMKHVLRAEEREQIVTTKPSTTKLIFPIDRQNLGTGGYSVLFEEISFQKKMHRYMGHARGFESFGGDMRKLRVLAESAMFDPFLIRERFRMHELTADEACFAITPAREDQVLSYLHDHIQALFLGATKDPVLSDKIADGFCYKVFGNEFSEYARYLNQFFAMNGRDIIEAAFAWKAFLYQRLVYQEHQSQILRNLRVIFDMPLPKGMRRDQRVFCERVQLRLKRRLHDDLNYIRDSFAAYDRANYDFSVLKNPSRFIAFLGEAIERSYEVGDRLGLLLHHSALIAHRLDFEYSLSEQRGAYEFYKDIDLSVSDFEGDPDDRRSAA